MYLFILVVVFLGLQLFPFLLSIGVKIDKENSISLIVKDNNVRDPRYFAKSFKSMLKPALKNKKTVQGGVDTIELSKEEKLILWDGKLDIGNDVESLVSITKSVEMVKEGMNFRKEIFTDHYVEFADNTTLRAISGRKSVVIGKNSVVKRWADAKELMVLKTGSVVNSNLTSKTRVVIEPGCTFKRLFAPSVEVHHFNTIIDEPLALTVINRETPVYMGILRDIDLVKQQEEVRKTIVTRSNLLIGAGSTIYGDIKSDKSVHIKGNTVVTGNIFADENIILEMGVKVLGDVFAGNNLYVGPDVTIGKTGRTKSAIAVNNMVISEGCVFHGYVGVENEGVTVGYNKFAGEVMKREKIEVSSYAERVFSKIFNLNPIICQVDSNNQITFSSVGDYETVDYYAFRDNDILESVIIPDGAKVIRSSMFYGCVKLKTVVIPDSVELIERFAFYNCLNLENVKISRDSKLKEIGSYAFSECKSLEKIELSKVEKIGAAAFRGDVVLSDFTIYNDGEVKCGDSVFQGCHLLKETDFLMVSNDDAKNLEYMKKSTI